MQFGCGVFIICCLGFIIYSNSLGASFHFDDELFIVSNSSIRGLFNLRALFDFNPPRFLTNLSFALNYHFHQLHVFGFHLGNLLIHVAAALSLRWLLLLTFLTPRMKHEKISRHAALVASFAGLIFVAHPIQTEAVTYLYQRAASLATLLYLFSLCLYVKSRLLQQEKLPGAIVRTCYYAGAFLAALAAMFTKEMAFTLPCVILLYELFFLKTKKTLDWRSSAPFLFMLLVIPLTLMISQSKSAAGVLQQAVLDSPISPWHYFLTQCRVLVTYLRLLLIPLQQNLDYDYPIATQLLSAPILASIFLLIGLLAIGLRLFARYRLLSFALFWFFLTLLPESSFIPLKDVIFEHRLYLPMAGYSFFLVGSLYYLFGEKRMASMVVVLSLVVASYAFLTYSRNSIWKDETSLWNDVIKKSPRKPRPYSERGNAYKMRGDLLRTMLDFNKAIALDPSYDVAYNNRGTVFVTQGNVEQAIVDFNKAIELNPRSAEAYYNRANAFKIKGKLNEAIKDYGRAIEIRPRFAMAYHNRAALYQEKKDVEHALSDYSQALLIEPLLDLAYCNRGNVYLEKGDSVEAIRDYTSALRLNPGSARAYLGRAKAYFLQREYQKCWKDVQSVEGLGFTVPYEFLEALTRATGTGR